MRKIICSIKFVAMENDTMRVRRSTHEMLPMKIAPDSPHLNYSDYIHLEKCSQAARFRRPIEGEDGFHFDNPGARIRFCTDARRVEAHLYYSARHTRTDAVNGNGAYLRDGELKSIYRTTERPGALQLELETARDGAAHLYEIVLPYGDSVEFRGLEVNEEANFLPLRCSHVGAGWLTEIRSRTVFTPAT